MLNNGEISKKIIIGFIILVLLITAVGLIFDYQDSRNAESDSTTEAVQTISTGSMPADTLEKRAEMRKMTAIVYNHSD
jgi:CHASE3 domain sensor protein